jgi:hypothetical protein
MEQQDKKKEWVAPELVVLVRSHPEEAVLTACKFTALSDNPTASFFGCASLICDSVCSTNWGIS